MNTNTFIHHVYLQINNTLNTGDRINKDDSTGMHVFSRGMWVVRISVSNNLDYIENSGTIFWFIFLKILLITTIVLAMFLFKCRFLLNPFDKLSPLSLSFSLFLSLIHNKIIHDIHTCNHIFHSNRCFVLCFLC